jgi:hypothetical protein
MGHQVGRLFLIRRLFFGSLPPSQRIRPSSSRREVLFRNNLVLVLQTLSMDWTASQVCCSSAVCEPGGISQGVMAPCRKPRPNEAQSSGSSHFQCCIIWTGQLVCVN